MRSAPSIIITSLAVIVATVAGGLTGVAPVLAAPPRSVQGLRLAPPGGSALAQLGTFDAVLLEPGIAFATRFWERGEVLHGLTHSFTASEVRRHAGEVATMIEAMRQSVAGQTILALPASAHPVEDHDATAWLEVDASGRSRRSDVSVVIFGSNTSRAVPLSPDHADDASGTAVAVAFAFDRQAFEVDRATAALMPTDPVVEFGSQMIHCSDFLAGARPHQDLVANVERPVFAGSLSGLIASGLPSQIAGTENVRVPIAELLINGSTSDLSSARAGALALGLFTHTAYPDVSVNPYRLLAKESAVLRVRARPDAPLAADVARSAALARYAAVNPTEAVLARQLGRVPRASASGGAAFASGPTEFSRTTTGSSRLASWLHGAERVEIDRILPPC